MCSWDYPTDGAPSSRQAKEATLKALRVEKARSVQPKSCAPAGPRPVSRPVALPCPLTPPPPVVEAQYGVLYVYI